MAHANGGGGGGGRRSYESQNQSQSWYGGSRADGKKPMTSGFRDSDRWVRKGGGLHELERERPKLVLDPPKGEIRLNEAVNTTTTNRPNPFGAARPREEVLAEKGLDWKKLDLEIDAAKKSTSRPTSAHSSSSEEVENVVKSRHKVNPFGDAKPREVLLEERGQDWRKIDLQLDAAASSSTSKEKEEVPISVSPSFSIKERPRRDLISLLSGRSPLDQSSSMAAVPTQEEVNGAFEALRTLLEKPAVEVFNTPADRDQCRKLVIMLSSHYTSMENRIILDDFSSRLPVYEESIFASLSTREYALAFQDINRPRANELDIVLEQGRTLLSSLHDKLDELTQSCDTIAELIEKLEAERDQIQTSITETTTQLENLSGQVSSDYQAWHELQQKSIKAGKDLIHSENTIAGVELAWSTLKRRLFNPLN